MIELNKNGYVIAPEHCDGCRYAIVKGGNGSYSHCDLYFQTKRAKRPTPDKCGRCIHKDTSPKGRSTTIWEEY